MTLSEVKTIVQDGNYYTCEHKENLKFRIYCGQNHFMCEKCYKLCLDEDNPDMIECDYCNKYIHKDDINICHIDDYSNELVCDECYDLGY